jgi:hypothetical protein
MKISVLLPKSRPGAITKRKASYEKAHSIWLSNNHDLPGGIVQGGIYWSANCATITLATHRSCHLDAKTNNDTFADNVADNVADTNPDSNTN